MKKIIFSNKIHLSTFIFFWQSLEKSIITVLILIFTLKNMKNLGLLKKGFTLIELLVVITIIGILATGATATYTTQIQKARDTTRINDIKALDSWVNQSYNDVSEYPKGSTLSPELAKYMWKFPKDPKHAQPCNDGGVAANAPDCAYAYIAGPDNNWISFWEYELSTAFENLWNVTEKAGKDGGGIAGWQIVRLEIWLDTPNNNTTVGKDSVWNFSWITNAAWSAVAAVVDDELVVLINGN